MWELNDKGNLVSSYSRLCAKVESSKEGGTHGITLFCELDGENVTYLAQFSMQLVLLERVHGLQREVKVSDHLYPTAYIRSYESNPFKLG
jgi:hypothetical protein